MLSIDSHSPTRLMNCTFVPPRWVMLDAGLNLVLLLLNFGFRVVEVVEGRGSCALVSTPQLVYCPYRWLGPPEEGSIQ